MLATGVGAWGSECGNGGVTTTLLLVGQVGDKRGPTQVAPNHAMELDGWVQLGSNWGHPTSIHFSHNSVVEKLGQPGLAPSCVQVGSPVPTVSPDYRSKTGDA